MRGSTLLILNTENVRNNYYLQNFDIEKFLIELIYCISHQSTRMDVKEPKALKTQGENYLQIRTGV